MHNACRILCLLWSALIVVACGESDSQEHSDAALVPKGAALTIYSPTAALTWPPPEYDPPEVVVDVTNTGDEKTSGPIVATVAGDASAVFEVAPDKHTCDTALEVGASCQVTIVFDPGAQEILASNYEATLELQSGEALVTFQLTGVVRSAYADCLSYSPASILITGVEPNESQRQRLRITNGCGEPRANLLVDCGNLSAGLKLSAVYTRCDELADGEHCDVFVEASGDAMMGSSIFAGGVCQLLEGSVRLAQIPYRATAWQY